MVNVPSKMPVVLAKALFALSNAAQAWLLAVVMFVFCVVLTACNMAILLEFVFAASKAAQAWLLAVVILVFCVSLHLELQIYYYFVC
jgi:cytochrome c biogenesis protein CcdA